VLWLQRAMYGLRQALKAWNKCLETEFSSRGFAQSDKHPALWILCSGSVTVMSMVPVDDGLVRACMSAEAHGLVELAASIFEIRSLGEPKGLCPKKSAGTLQQALSLSARRGRPSCFARHLHSSWV
jgi:hypothetical protein